MDHSPLLAWIKDDRLRFQYLNAAFEIHRGVLSKEAIGKTYLELAPGKIAEKTHQIDNQVLYTQEPIEHIEEHTNAGGETRKWLVTRFPIPGPEGATWVAGTAIDLTDHVKLQDESRFTSFGLEHAAVALFMVDSNANILRVNEAATHHSGYSKEELCRMQVHDLNPDLPPNRWGAFWRELKENKILRLESSHRNKNGHLFPIEVETNFFEYQGKDYAFAFIRNISRRRELTQKQEALQKELEARIEELQQQKLEAIKLAQENQLTNFVLEHAIFGLYMVDAEANIQRVNLASSLQSGYSEDELLGMNLHDVDSQYHPDQWQEVWGLIKEKKVLHFESSHRRKDGSEFPIEVEANYVNFEGKEYIAAFVRDISERKILEKNQEQLQQELQTTVLELRQKQAAALALANENDLTSFALDHAVVPFYLVDENARILRMNEAAIEQTGFTRNELIMMTVQDLNPSSTNESWTNWWKKLKHEKFLRFEEEHLCKDGRIIPVEIEANYIIFEGFGYNVCFVRDISDRKKLEQSQLQQQQELERRVEKRTAELLEHRKTIHELGKENEFMGIAVENASVAFFLIDENAKILRVNTAASRQTGFSREELTGMHVADLDPDFPADAWPDHWIDLKKNKLLRFETRHKHKDGTIVPKEVEANYVELEGKGYNFAFSRDISDRREWAENKEKLQQELEKQVEHQSQTMAVLKTTNEELTRSNEELDKFAFAASHDLKSPLFAIHNLVDVIEEDAGHLLPDSAKQAFGKLQRRVQHMEDLLESLLTYSRVGHMEDIPSEQSMQELLESIISLLGMPIGVQVDIPHDLPTLTAPRGALFRVFTNLFGNAIKHGGREDLQLTVRWQDLGDELEFSISDNGVGIDPMHHDRVFEMFKTLQPSHSTGSSGMGLALVRKTITHFGGKVRLDSEPGKGTTISFTWPKYRPKVN
jgi:PAS domain S-box-containing protein